MFAVRPSGFTHGFTLGLAQGKSLALYVYGPGIPDSVYKHVNIWCIAP